MIESLQSEDNEFSLQPEMAENEKAPFVHDHPKVPEDAGRLALTHFQQEVAKPVEKGPQERRNSTPKGPNASPRPRRESRQRHSYRLRKEENPEEDIVRLYLQDIGKVPLLTKADEISLGKQVRDGMDAAKELEAAAATSQKLTAAKEEDLRNVIKEGEEAQATFVKANLRLVVSIAKKYQGSNLHILDRIQEGNLGLMHAVTKFDERKGFKFSTYASWWIRQAISRGIANTQSVIRTPVHTQDRLTILRTVTQSLQTKLQREPTDQEIAQAMDINKKELDAIRQIVPHVSSLDDQLSDDPKAQTLADIVPDPSTSGEIDRKLSEIDSEKVVRSILASLSERERDIIRLHFGLEDGYPKSLEEIGEMKGLTRERIRQIEKRVFDRIRNPSSQENS